MEPHAICIRTVARISAGYAETAAENYERLRWMRLPQVRDWIRRDAGLFSSLALSESRRILGQLRRI